MIIELNRILESYRDFITQQTLLFLLNDVEDSKFNSLDLCVFLDCMSLIINFFIIRFGAVWEKDRVQILKTL